MYFKKSDKLRFFLKSDKTHLFKKPNKNSYFFLKFNSMSEKFNKK